MDNCAGSAHIRGWIRDADRSSKDQLRHTYATAVRRAMGPDAAGAALGHSRPSTTEVYAERDAALAVEAARRLG